MPAAEQQKELEKYTKPPSDKRKELERAASKAQKEKDKANGTTPPSGGPGTFDRIILNDERGSDPSDAPVTDGKDAGKDAKNAGKVPPGGSSRKPRTEDQLRESLKRRKYSQPAIDEMIKDHKAAADDAAKVALEDEFLDKDKIATNEAKYKAKANGGTAEPTGGATEPPKDDKDGKTVPKKDDSAAEIKTAADLDKALTAAGYSEPARKRMIKAWEKAKDPKAKKGLAGNWLKPDQKSKYETRYNDEGKEPLAKEDIEALQNALKKTYDDPTVAKMVDKWRKAPNNKARDKIYDDIMSKDPAQIAKNKKDYGSSSTAPPVDPPTEDEEKKLRDSLKAAKAKYDPETIENMVKDWKKTPKEKRKELESKLKSDKDSDVKSNKKKYGKKAANGEYSIYFPENSDLTLL